MQGWSRMAALTLFAGWVLLTNGPSMARAADENTPKQSPAAQGKVTLTLVISGLKEGSSEVEIRPGNGACAFKPQTSKVKSAGESFVQVQVKDLEIKTTSADRECSLSITIKEPGQVDRYTRRGFRLAPAAGDKPQLMTYYLNSSALASKVVDTDRKTK